MQVGLLAPVGPTALPAPSGVESPHPKDPGDDK
jgi:hypothetical protein